MGRFTVETGLSGDSTEVRRYLWTDAFAVCNFLELYRETGDVGFVQKALQLVHQVHHVLGRFHINDVRQGWISGLDDDEGEEHPTCGGLRIGKDLGERKLDEPFDEQLEWSRDGQYFHYLTKWMQALDRVSKVTGEPHYHHWAVELAKVAHAAFRSSPYPDGRLRLCWKMSVDLSYALVPAMAPHDPLEGFITFHQLRTGCGEFGVPYSGVNLNAEIAETASMCRGASWQTIDPLGIGGLLTNAYRLTHLITFHGLCESAMLSSLLRDAERSLGEWVSSYPLDKPVSQRLPFRELGLSIGLSAIPKVQDLLKQFPHQFPSGTGVRDILTRLASFLPLGEAIIEFWLRIENQENCKWLEHRDINTVMLATSLGPEAFLSITGHAKERMEFPVPGTPEGCL